MGKAVKRFVTRLAVAVLIVLAAYAGWKGGDAVFPRLETALGIGNGGEPVAPDLVTPEAADLARERIEAFRESEDALELRLKPFEVSSLLRYALPGVLPRGVVEPTVNMEGDRIELVAGVMPSELPELPDLGGITGAIVPDTVSVSASGSLIPFGEQGSMLLVREIVVGGIPIPSSAFPEILAALGRKDEQGLPASAIRAPAFKEIKSAYIEGGELVLVRA
ncbi:MAG: hypothetical protein OXF01_04630 [Gemmatimonadetes bacterium]|nr:hypothetical protein [Gemmatimonadota bacterium]